MMCGYMFGVNPKETTVYGLPFYGDRNSLMQANLVLIAVPAAAITPLLKPKRKIELIKLLKIKDELIIETMLKVCALKKAATTIQ